jgi:hypothetical protein
MSDGLPNLLPGDPQNLVSVEARKRIQRALIEGEKFLWEAEILIEQRHLSDDGDAANSLRSNARFKKAKAALSTYRAEFSRIDLPERRFRQYMKDEIEAASNSLQLSGAQQRLLETEFFFPLEQRAKTREANPTSFRPQRTETVAFQINALREECRLTAEELAEKIDVDIRSVQRHLSSKSTPYARNLQRYEREFSKLLNRQIVTRKMS